MYFSHFKASAKFRVNGTDRYVLETELLKISIENESDLIACDLSYK